MTLACGTASDHLLCTKPAVYLCSIGCSLRCFLKTVLPICVGDLKAMGQSSEKKLAQVSTAEEVW